MPKDQAKEKGKQAEVRRGASTDRSSPGYGTSSLTPARAGTPAGASPSHNPDVPLPSIEGSHAPHQSKWIAEDPSRYPSSSGSPQSTQKSPPPAAPAPDVLFGAGWSSEGSHSHTPSPSPTPARFRTFSPIDFRKIVEDRTPDLADPGDSSTTQQQQHLSPHAGGTGSSGAGTKRLQANSPSPDPLTMRPKKKPQAE